MKTKIDTKELTTKTVYTVNNSTAMHAWAPGSKINSAKQDTYLCYIHNDFCPGIELADLSKYDVEIIDNPHASNPKEKFAKMFRIKKLSDAKAILKKIAEAMPEPEEESEEPAESETEQQ